MRLRPLLFLILAMALVGRAAAAPEGASNPARPTAPVVASTRQSAFAIPFRIEAAQTPAQQPVEVQLHVSTDQGATWAIGARVTPDKSAFSFRAPHDGEYWYSIRTVDKQGAVRPEGQLQAQLKVSVDTVAPRLEFTALRGDAGEIMAHWQAVDPNLKPDSFKLEYQSQPGGAWERVAVKSPPSAMRHTLSGEATWWPKSSSGTVRIRAEVTDLAGNPALNQAVVNLGDARPLDLAREADRNPSNDITPENSPRGPSDRQSSDPLRRPDLSSQAGTPPDAEGNWRGRGDGQRVAAQPVGQNGGPDPASSHLNFNVLPPGERPRMVNSRSFELEYEIDSVGPSGVGKVELWGTRDGGRTWTVFGVDSDNQSPIPVVLDSEGVFGFRIVVQSGSGLSAAAPVAGDLPQIWIGVDSTKPVGRITAADVSPDGSELVIRWEASDDAPDPRPIALSFAPSAGGPWTPIASGLENTGGYRWRLDNRVPDRIFLRLEVSDEAGNVATFDAPEAVPLDRQRPEGHIRGVRPVSQSDRSAKQER